MSENDNRIDPLVNTGETKAMTIGDGDVCAILGQCRQARWLLQNVLDGKTVRNDHLAASIIGLGQIFDQLAAHGSAIGMQLELAPELKAKVEAAERNGTEPTRPSLGRRLNGALAIGWAMTKGRSKGRLADERRR